MDPTDRTGLIESALESLGGALMATDSSGAITFMNRTACSLTGYAEAEALGRPAGTVLRLKDPLTGRVAAVPRAAAGSPDGQPGRVALVLISRNGSERYIRLTASPAGSDDPAGGTLLLFTDETKSIASEEALRNSERLYRGIVENSFDAIYLLRGKRYEYVNPRFCEITGYAFGELTSGDFDYNTLLAPGSREFMEERFQARKAGAEIPSRYRLEVVRKDGDLVEVEVSTVSLGRPGEILVLGIMRDITEQVRAAEGVEQSDDLLRSIFSAMDDSVFKFDEQGRFVFVNAPRLELLMPPAQFLGRRFEEVMPPNLVEQFEKAMESARRGLRAEYEYELKLSRGKRFFAARLTPVMHDGVFRGAVAVVRDITENRRRLDEQRILEEQLGRTQKFESLGMLAGGIAHDFNNLLMGILGNADMLLDELRCPPGPRAHLTEISSSARRAAELCRQMLAYAGRGSSRAELLDISQLIEDVSDLLKVNLPASARIRLDLARDLPPVDGDAAQLGQVVFSLVTNAVEALGNSDGMVTIATSSAFYDREYIRSLYLPEHMEPGSFVCLEVSDTGVGIDSASREKLFDPFYSTKGPGRGLGLAAVLGIARGHGGSVKVYSEPGSGTTVKVLLPAAADLRAGPAADSSRASREPSGRVLVIDDEEIVRSVLERMLDRLGFSVDSTGSGQEALRFYREDDRRYDCVILDLAMPGMDGPEVLEAIRRIDPAAKVLIASGYSEQQVEDKLRICRPDGFIQKPFRLDRLSRALESLFMRDTPGPE